MGQRRRGGDQYRRLGIARPFTAAAQRARAAAPCSMRFADVAPYSRSRRRSPRNSSNGCPTTPICRCRIMRGKARDRLRVRRRTQSLPLARRLDRESQPRDAAASRRERVAARARTRRRGSERSTRRTTSIRRSTSRSGLRIARRPDSPSRSASSRCSVSPRGGAGKGPGHFFAALGIVALALATIGCCWNSQRSHSPTRSPAPAFPGPPIRGRGD